MRPFRSAFRAALTLAALTVACGRPSVGSSSLSDAPGARPDALDRLPTGARLDPAAPPQPVGQMPLAMVNAPEGDRAVLLLNGWRDHGIQVVARATGRVLQTVRLPTAFLGLVFSPDGRSLYAAGGNTDVVYDFSWRDGVATLRDSIVLQPRATVKADGVRYPGGLAISRDGRWLYVAENLGDSLAVIDVQSRRVVQRLATDRYPYAVAVAPDGAVYVSNWGGWHLSAYATAADGSLHPTGRIFVGRHPSALLLNARGTRLFVATATTDRVVAVDLARRRIVGELLDPPPAGPAEGSTPNALALSTDEQRLFVAEGDANAVAVFDLSPSSSGVAGARGDDRLAGRIPTAWYPTSLLARGDTLLVGAAKGLGTRANPDGPQPASARARRPAGPPNTTLSQLDGAFMTLPLGGLDARALESYSARVARANGWTEPHGAARRYPPFEHVVYIVKENRTYDQMLGDLPLADGDTSLALFGRAVTPNHHALAERFGAFDRFFVNAEVSADGHNWSTAAYTSDYLQKTVQAVYSNGGRTYDYEGTNRGVIPEDDAAEPARGYLWTMAEQKGITFRNYGEFVLPSGTDADDPLPAGYRGNKPYLAAHTNPTFAGFDLTIPDQRRADVWIAELEEFARRGVMPALEIVRLPNDHTAGARAGSPTPRAMVADNDLALGRMIAALSRSPFWKSTVVFVLEDDAQSGPDHVDSHRSPLFVVSPYTRAGVVHRFANTTDVLRTIEEILGLDALSQFDYFGRPLREIWSDAPDLRPWDALMPAVSLTEKNAAGTADARVSARLDLRVEDAAAEEPFNRVIWRSVKGAVPYPGARRASTLEAVRR